MKLIVSIAVMDAVDKRGWKLSDPVLLRKQDLSLYMQPISKLVGQAGYRTTAGDLIRRAIVDSDSAAVDFLVAKLGGIEQVQAFLNRRKISGVRLDRLKAGLQKGWRLGHKTGHPDGQHLAGPLPALPP